VSGCFVRALFGDAKIPNFQHVLDEVKWCMAQPFQPSPTLWFAYGRENADYLASLGVEPLLMDADAFCRFGSEREEQAHHYATVRHGVSVWRMKYPCIRAAMERHGECIWLDLDTVLTKPLPADFWPRMADGQPFKATLQINCRKRAGWRVKQTWPGKGPQIDEDARKTPAGACLYFRGLEVVDKLLALYAAKPFEYDLHILAMLTDNLMGGWKGWREYKTMGFEPYCHSLGSYEKRQIFKPEERVFVTEWRKPRLRGYGPTETPYMLAGEFRDVKAVQP